MSAAPATRHQKIVYRLHDVLDAVCPHHLELIGAPFAVQLSFNTEVQPDLLVAPIEDFTDKKLPAPPLLAVEVLSRKSSRSPLMRVQPARTASTRVCAGSASLSRSSKKVRAAATPFQSPGSTFTGRPGSA